MKELQLLLDKLDILFVETKKIEKIAIYILIVMILGAVLKLYVLPMNTKKINIVSNKVQMLKRALKDNARAVKDNEEQKIFLKEIERSNESIKEEIQNNKQALKYIRTKIDNQHKIKFSSDQWGIFFKQVQTKANKHKIKISKISNAPIQIEIPKDLKKEERIEYLKKQKKEFRAIFKIELQAIATFRNLMEFLIDIEENKLITKISKLRITNNNSKTLKFSLEISLWGIK